MDKFSRRLKSPRKKNKSITTTTKIIPPLTLYPVEFGANPKKKTEPSAAQVFFEIRNKKKKNMGHVSKFKGKEEEATGSLRHIEFRSEKLLLLQSRSP